MYVVVVNARERKEEGDQQLVSVLLKALKDKYPSLIVVTAACDKGMARYVKEVCLGDKKHYKMIEVQTRIYADLPRMKLAQVFICRNSVLAELGDEFHVFVNKDRRGSIEDLIERVQKLECPLYIYMPGAGLNPAKSKNGEDIPVEA